MVFEWFLNNEGIFSVLTGDVFGMIIAFGILTLFLFLTAVYLYSSFAWYTISKKLKYHSPWLAWIPIANIVLFLQLGGFHWGWIFLLLIPIFGWIPLFVLIIIATWKIFEKRNYPGWFSLAFILPWIGPVLYLVAIGFVAWADKKAENSNLKSKRNK